MERPAVNKLRRSRKLNAVWREAEKAFALDLGKSLHGAGHWRQVEKNAIELAQNTPGCDIEVARLFAALHDCKRQDEEEDTGHGRRAAEFAQELFDKGMLDIDPEQFSTLKFAIKHHNGGSVSSDPTIGVCWDADRLDLPRVGINPVANMLSTPHARSVRAGS